MDAQQVAHTRRGGVGSPELWLTPLIGVPLLTYYIRYHGFLLAGSIVPTILIGITPLAATAVVQRILRAMKWNGWVRVLIAVVVGYALLYGCYYYARYPSDLFRDPERMRIDPEGTGDDMTIFKYQCDNFGIIGALAAMASTLLTMVLTRRR